MSREVLWIDCETGGIDEKINALIQLSAIIEIDGKEVDSIDLKMRPFGKKIIEPKALEVQGRTVDEVSSFEDPVKCFYIWKKFLSRRPASKTNRYIMAGYNTDFDCRFISAWYQDMTGGPYEYWDYLQFSPIDVLPVLRGMRHYGVIEATDTKLETMCNYFEIKIDAHDSMSDILATRLLTNYVFDKIKKGWN